MDAPGATHLVLKLINTLVRICELIPKFSKHCRNIRRTPEEGIRQLFFHLFCLMIFYVYSLLLLVITSYITILLFTELKVKGVPG